MTSEKMDRDIPVSTPAGDHGIDTTGAASSQRSLDFIRTRVEKDLRTGKNATIVTRFPPEPNGYLHIGHAKAICIDFGIASDYGGRCNLRFDDTNPMKEESEYVESIQHDIRWLGFDWGEHLYHASEYFDRLHGFAVALIEKGLAYVDGLSADEIREHRGTLTEPGKNSPYRDRSIEENLRLFERMKDGEFEDGTHVLRAKIDMTSPNMSLRDPTLYRIRRANHHRTGDAWVIYPMYDFTHPLSDAIEGVSHSLCSLEFENQRPLYDWVLDNVDVGCHPQQIEFARLAFTHTILSKRRLIELVDGGHVKGWDDPRMPTLAGMRRRGYPSAAIRTLCDRVGVAKANSTVEIQMLEHCVREELNRITPRVMGVLRPLKIVITNYPEDQIEEFEAINNPEDAAAGSRMVPFSREIYIERDDFMEDPPKKFFRLAPGVEIRLKHAYYIKCEDVIKDAAGEVVELRCSYDPESRGGQTPDGRKIRGTSHWVSAKHALDAEVRIYGHLFGDPFPGADRPYLEDLNPDSLEVLEGAKVEPSLKEQEPGTLLQFLRQGYYCLDPDSTVERLVFNQTVTLKDSWAKIQRKS